MLSREPVAGVVADANGFRHAAKPGDRHSKINAVEKIGLEDVDLVLSQQSCQRSPGANGMPACERADSQTKHRAIGWLQTARYDVLTVKQHEKRFDSRAIK